MSRKVKTPEEQAVFNGVVSVRDTLLKSTILHRKLEEMFESEIRHAIKMVKLKTKEMTYQFLVDNFPDLPKEETEKENS